MDIIKRKTYRIKGESKYFEKKYGTCNPSFVVEGTDREVFGCFWGGLNHNPTAMFYGMRAGFEGLPIGGQVYYGHIGGIGELAHETELEEVKHDKEGRIIC